MSISTNAAPSALELVEQAVERLNADSVASDDYGDDRRLGFLFAAQRNWHAEDRRWHAARLLIEHDTHPDGIGVMREYLGLLVRITDLLEGFLLDVREPRDADAEVRREARELRDANERLGEIVRAVTAMPLLGEPR